MKVLVTGAYGYLGRALLLRLQRAAGVEVTAFGRATDERIGVVAFRMFGGDLARGEIVDDTAYDAIVHLAGGGGPATCESNPIKAIRDNVLSVHALDNVVAVRRILASSLYVYPPENRAMKESDATDPETVYGACKEAAEAAWSGNVLRFAHIYGPSPKPHNDVVTRFAQAEMRGEPAPVHGRGDRRIDLLHIDDACSAIIAALRARELPDVINVGGGSPITVSMIAAMATSRGRTVPPPGPADVPDRWLDCALAREVLDWQPTIAPGYGIPAFVESLRAGTR